MTLFWSSPVCNHVKLSPDGTEPLFTFHVLEQKWDFVFTIFANAVQAIRKNCFLWQKMAIIVRLKKNLLFGNAPNAARIVDPQTLRE